MEFDYMGWIVVPCLIFVARLADVSLATMRHILIFKGMRKVVPILGFVEVMIWLMAITQVMQNLTNVACYLAFGLGFAAGTYVGILVEERLALGHQLVRIITARRSPDLQEMLREHNYAVTVVPARGSQGPVDIFFVAVERKRIRNLLMQLHDFDEKLFFTVEDIRSVTAGVFSRGAPTLGGSAASLAMEGTVKKK